MAATLKTIDADGTIHLAEPLKGPARAVITVLIDDIKAECVGDYPAKQAPDPAFG